MSIFAAILGLGILIFVHECGHFFASIALRMRPRKFYVGFPPAVLKTTRGGIEYGLGAIPLGGFVKIPGMHRPAPADVDAHFHQAVAEASELAAPLDRLRRALQVGSMEQARELLPPTRALVGEASLTPQARHAAERGLTELDDALGPDAYWRARSWKRVAVIFAGPAANILLAVVLFTGLFMSSGGEVTATVGRVTDDTPAARMGLEPGDTIVAIGGSPVAATGISRAISGSNGEPLTLTVLRDGNEVQLGPAAPRRGDDDRYRLGFVLESQGMGAGSAFSEALRVTGLITKEIGASLGRLVQGEGREDIASPVGIVQGSSQAADQGAESFLWVLGLISLSIALLNLLPLLPLDGGHIAFAVIEGIRGRSVGREIYERVSMVGIGLVLLLFFVGLTNDIGRLS